MNRLISTPIVLRTTVNVAPVASMASAPAVLNSNLLQNTLRVPIEITEMLVTVRKNAVALTLNHTPGAALELDLRVDRYLLTDGYVPFRALAPWNYGEDQAWQSILIGLGGPNNKAIGFDQRRLVFPSPILLRSGVGFSGSVRQNLPVGVTGPATDTETVGITFIGRIATGKSQSPIVQEVPYWMAKTFYQTGASAETLRTTETELVNGFLQPLTVRRMTIDQGLWTTLGVRGEVSPGPTVPIDFRWPNGDRISLDVVETISIFAKEHSMQVKFAVPHRGRINAEYRASVGREHTVLGVFGTRQEVL